jgi:uncharacterized membrane protein YbhN (UPF0104 family)
LGESVAAPEAPREDRSGSQDSQETTPIADVEAPARPHSRIVKILLLLISGAILGVLIWKTGASDVLSLAVRIPPLSLVGAILAGFLALALRAPRFLQLARPFAHVDLKPAYHMVMISMLYNTVAPAKLGDLAKAGRLRRIGVPIGTGVSVVFAEVAIELSVMAALTFAGLAILANGTCGCLGSGEWFVAAGGVASAAIGTFLLTHPHAFRLVLQVAILLPKRARQLVERLLTDLHNGLRSYGRRWQVIGAALLWTLLIWSVEGLHQWLLLVGLGQAPSSLLYVIPLHAAGALLGRLSLLPGGVGSTELFLVLFYGALGVSAEVATTVAIVDKLVMFSLMGCLGFLSQLVAAAPESKAKNPPSA